MILLQHCLNAEPPGEEYRYYPVYCDMSTGNWGHGKPQAVPTVSSYTVAIHQLENLQLPSEATALNFQYWDVSTCKPSPEALDHNL